MICGHGHEQKFKYPYPRGSNIIQNALPPGQSDLSNPCPAQTDLKQCVRLEEFSQYGPQRRMELTACKKG